MIKHLSLAVSVLSLGLACGGSAREQAERSEPPAAPHATAGAGSAGALAAPTGLRVATWNLEWLNRKNGTGPVKRDDADYARLRRYVDKLQADVIAFQEVDGEQAAARVFAPETYTVHVAAQNNPQRTGFAYRKSLQVTVHPDYAALDVGQVRSGADISVRHAGRTIRMLSVHLKSGCFDGALAGAAGNDCRKLAAQLPSLEEWIDARGSEGAAAIVLGDFNRRFFVRGEDAFWREIDDREPPASDLWSPTEGQRARCWGGKYPDFIDHIVFNVPARALVVPDSFAQLLYDESDRDHKGVLSDHCPLAITLGSKPAASVGQAASTVMVATDARPPARVDPPANSPARGDTRIKGNINGKGKKLYHAPGCPEYARTQIDETKGERWFADAKAAETAGWERASNCH